MTSVLDSARVNIPIMERELVSRRETGFENWLDHVQILEPPPGEGLIKFVKWEHLMDAIECFKVNRLICILKSRQIGFSWLVAAYSLWTALYQDGAVILLFSQGENEAGELLGKILMPDRNANLDFGGPDGTTLFIGVNAEAYSIEVNARRAARP